MTARVYDLTTVAPEDFDTASTTRFWNSPLADGDLETVAHSIVIACKRLGGWVSFSWDLYCSTVDHNPGLRERKVFYRLTQIGYLKFTDEKYSVTDKFVATLAEFIK